MMKQIIKVLGLGLLLLTLSVCCGNKEVEKYTTIARFSESQGKYQLERHITIDGSKYRGEFEGENGQVYDIDEVREQTDPTKGTEFVYNKYWYKDSEEPEYKGILYVPAGSKYLTD